MTKRDLGIDELRQDNHISVSALTDDGLIDPATSIRTLMRHKDGKILSLVMSDEFIEVGRSFEPGKDDMFEAVEKPDYTNDAIQFCKTLDAQSTLIMLSSCFFCGFLQTIPVYPM